MYNIHQAISKCVETKETTLSGNIVNTTCLDL